MSISGITKDLSSYVKGVVSSGASPTSVAAAAQEATETKAQTLKEAQKGDRVAIKKLQHEQEQEQAQSISQSGDGIDAKA